MRIITIAMASLTAWALFTGQARADERTVPGDRLDHILLWGRTMDQATAVMSAKLGFQVRPGRTVDGVANRYVRLADGSFVELLALSGGGTAKATLDPGAQADQARLQGEAGARTFGIHSSALDAAHALLAARGAAVTPVFSASADDPDGPGPGGPPRWRLFAFEQAPLSSPMFFVDYAPLRSDVASRSDDRLARVHPNGAKQLSAVWLLSDQVEADRRQLAYWGFEHAEPVRLPALGARGYAIAIGPSRLLLLAPEGAGIAADAARRGGNQVLGISVGVSDLDQAQRRVERGYERFGQPLARYASPFGQAFLAPSLEDLGLWIEFHAVQGGTAQAGAARSREDVAAARIAKQK